MGTAALSLLAVAGTAVVLATSQGRLWHGVGGPKTELLVADPLWGGSDEPWVLGGGPQAVLGQLQYAREETLKAKKAAALRAVHPARSGREQQLAEEELNPDDPVRIHIRIWGQFPCQCTSPYLKSC